MGEMNDEQVATHCISKLWRDFLEERRDRSSQIHVDAHNGAKLDWSILRA